MKLGFPLILCATALAAQTVQGIVVDAVTGAPLPGTYVSIYSTKQTVTRTDSAGFFRLDRVALPLQANRYGYLPASNVDPGQGQDLTIRLTPEAVISGKVEDEDGFPVEGAQVEAMRFLQVDGARVLRVLQRGKSNDLGEYRIGGVGPGSYYLRVTVNNLRNWDKRYVDQYIGGDIQPNDERKIDMKTGEHRTGTDITLRKHEGVTVSGRVELSPGPSGSRLSVVLQGQGEGTLPSRLYAVQSPDGSFSIPHVPPGRYKLVAQSGGGRPQAGDLLAEVPLEVGSADLRNLAIRPHAVEAVDVPGIFVVDGGGTPMPMLIGLHGPAGTLPTVHSEPDGSFVLKGLFPGHYSLRLNPDQSAARLSSAAPAQDAMFPLAARLGDAEILQQGFDIDGPPPSPIRITLGKLIDVKGKLLDAAGLPVPGAAIAFISGTGQTNGGARSDMEGNFRGFVRRAGDYHVYIDEDGNSLTNPDYLQEHEKDFPVVHLVSGENPPLVLRLPAK